MQKQIMKKQSMEKQKGMTFISWMVVIVFIGFHFMMAIRIIPIFAEDHTIKSIWKTMENDTALVGASPIAIRDAVMKKFKINNVTALTKDDIKVKKTQNYYIISVEYDPRGKIIGPLDFIVSFKHEVKINFKE